MVGFDGVYQLGKKLDEEYLVILERIKQLDEQYNSSADLKDIDEKIKALTEKRLKLYNKYRERLLPLVQRKEEILDYFKSIYDGQKTTSYGVLKLSYRITKSLKIIDPIRVVTILQNINKVNEGIKEFSLSYLRKLKDADVIDDSAAKYEESIGISVSTEE